MYPPKTQFAMEYFQAEDYFFQGGETRGWRGGVNELAVGYEFEDGDFAQNWAAPYGRDLEERNPLASLERVLLFSNRDSLIDVKEKKRDGGLGCSQIPCQGWEDDAQKATELVG